VSIIFSGLGLTKKSDRLSTASPDETLSWPVKLDGLRTSSGAPKSINSKVIIGSDDGGDSAMWCNRLEGEEKR
jgi:hypothetical protein